MSERVPRVSIGLAVRNGEQFLEDAIDSILAQTYRDFELIISDNASTDRTEEICRRYASLDARIRYQRNLANIGGANNENLTFKMARGEYFRWAAHDDVCAPTLIERCVEALDRRPEVILCYAKTILINDQGMVIREDNTGNKASSPRAHQRFSAVARARDYCGETYGLMRSAVLRRTQLQKNYTGSDRTLLAELSLYGQFHEVPEFLFYKRLHSGNYYLDVRVRMAWFETRHAGRIVFPFWMQLHDYLTTLWRVELTPPERLRCYVFMVAWMGLFGKSLIKDILVAAFMLVHSKQWRLQRYESLSEWS